ncbi:MAG: hypothetical protein AAF961_07880, partial [Planctomycetota bacterium]
MGANEGELRGNAGEGVGVHGTANAAYRASILLSAAAVRRFERDSERPRRYDAYLDTNQGMLNRLLQISSAPRCRPTAFGSPSVIDSREWMNLVKLVQQDAERWIDEGDLAIAWKRLLTLRQMEIHARQFEPSQLLLDQDRHRFGGTRLSESLLRRWRDASRQTPELLRKAALDLLSCERRYPDLAEATLAELQLLEEVAVGDLSPSLDQRSQSSDGWRLQFALAGHGFDWERKRAVRAAELLIGDRLDGIIATLDSTPANLRRIARSCFDGSGELTSAVEDADFYAWPALRVRQVAIDQARTSLLIDLELEARRRRSWSALREYLQGVALRRGEILGLALVAHRLEFGNYPEQLGMLWHDLADWSVESKDADGASTTTVYRPWDMSDPFTREPFGYAPDGFDRPVFTQLMKVPNVEFARPLLPAGVPAVWS